jgi:hypothetical protein
MCSTLGALFLQSQRVLPKARPQRIRGALIRYSVGLRCVRKIYSFLNYFSILTVQ